MSDSVRSNWNVTQEAFERLLAALGNGRASAAEEYELLRRKLVHHFAWQQQRDPGAMADEVLNRIARKLAVGVEIEDHRQYAFGIARLLVLETRRQEVRERQAFAARAQAAQPAEEGEYHCLENCLGQLQKENRELIMQYYQGEKRERIDARTVLAKQLGLELNALRNRALRIRHKLEECVADCIQCDESITPDSKSREKF